MKKILKYILLLSPIILTACGNHRTNPTSEPESESTSSESSEITPASGTVELYAINDFHGSVEPNGYEMGILKVGSYLKDRQEEENTVVINSGDYWQGSIQSNLNYGQYLTEIANEIEFDAMTLGNHEFDWGVQYIERNRELESETNYKTPILASNIYNYDILTDKVGDFADLGEKYVIKELENGIKVGIIGTIGSNQITTICSPFVDHLTFINPLDVVKEISQELRNKGCHIVVLSSHESVENTAYIEDAYGNQMTDYVDIIFGGHTHQSERRMIDGVPCLQGAYNGRAISKISIDLALDGTITVNEYNNLYDADFTVETDPEIEAIYNKYKSESDTKANEVVATLSSTVSKSNAPYLMTAGLAHYALTNDIDIDYAVVNGARNALQNKVVTYEDLFRAFPFDNKVFVLEVKGSELRTNLSKNYFYRLDPNKLEDTKTYTCAIIDYVALHRNNNRDYDNFTDITILDTYEKEGQQLYAYRDVCADWLLSLEGQEIDTSLFTNGSNTHNKYNISNDVTLPENPYVG